MLAALREHLTFGTEAQAMHSIEFLVKQRGIALEPEANYERRPHGNYIHDFLRFRCRRMNLPLLNSHVLCWLIFSEFFRPNTLREAKLWPRSGPLP